jgi:fermentation-respiration switch protein FrsA (DUF1100 family)
MMSITQTQADVSGKPPPPPRTRKRAALRLLIILVCGYLIGCGGLYVLQDRVLYPRDLIAAPTGSVPFAVTEMLFVDLEGGGRVEAAFIAAPGATAEHPAPLVVYCHGNSELIDQMYPIIAGYHKLGCSVLLPEYRGYGRSGGKPSQEGIGTDLAKLFDLASQRPEVDEQRIVFHGRSLGAAVAADLATRREPHVMIVQSAFTSVVAMAHRFMLPGFLVTNKYRTDHVLPGLGVPTLIFHGTQDKTVPVVHGRKLAELVPTATYVEYDCAHNDFPGAGNGRDYWDQIAAVLGKHGIIGSSPR